jgi:hypothetical protein
LEIKALSWLLTSATLPLKATSSAHNCVFTSSSSAMRERCWVSVAFSVIQVLDKVNTSKKSNKGSFQLEKSNNRPSHDLHVLSSSATSYHLQTRFRYHPMPWDHCSDHLNRPTSKVSVSLSDKSKKTQKVIH